MATLAGCARKSPISADTAIRMVTAIPEVVDWCGLVERNGNRTVIGVSQAGPTLAIPGNPASYWTVYSHEVMSTHFPRFETFLVREDGHEILVHNFADHGKQFLTLAEWRALRQEWRTAAAPLASSPRTDAAASP